MDFVLWLFTFCATLIGGVEIGLGSSVGLSLLFLIGKFVQPANTVVGRYQYLGFCFSKRLCASLSSSVCIFARVCMCIPFFSSFYLRLFSPAFVCVSCSLFWPSLPPSRAASVSHPRTAVLGRLPGTDVFRNVKRYRSVFRPRHAVIVRIDSAIFFANASIIKVRALSHSFRS